MMTEEHDPNRPYSPGERIRIRRRELGLSTAELGRLAAQFAGRSKPISGSAVRNQENGTNGVPFALIEAYAEALEVDSTWLLWGRTAEESAALWAEQETADEAVPIADLRVPISGIMSSGWVESTLPRPGQERFIYVSVTHVDEGVELDGYEVVDDSLSPTYPRGTVLITAPTFHTKVRDKDHLILATVEEDGVVLRSIREVRKRTKKQGGGADLVPIGSSDQPVLDWFHYSGGSRISRRIYPEELVVATYRPLSLDARGQLIELPDFLVETEESRAEAERGAIALEEAEEKARAERAEARRRNRQKTC